MSPDALRPISWPCVPQQHPSTISTLRNAKCALRTPFTMIRTTSASRRMLLLSPLISLTSAIYISILLPLLLLSVLRISLNTIQLRSHAKPASRTKLLFLSSLDAFLNLWSATSISSTILSPSNAQPTTCAANCQNTTMLAPNPAYPRVIVAKATSATTS